MRNIKNSPVENYFSWKLKKLLIFLLHEKLIKLSNKF